MATLPIDDLDAALYSVGQVAEMLDVQQAYLRRLDEHAVVRPERSSGGQRRYSRRQITRVLRVTVLIGDGLTLAAASRVLELEDRMRELEAELESARAEAGRLRRELAAVRPDRGAGAGDGPG